MCHYQVPTNETIHFGRKYIYQRLHNFWLLIYIFSFKKRKLVKERAMNIHYVPTFL